jgi:hypothetical protein
MVHRTGEKKYALNSVGETSRKGTVWKTNNVTGRFQGNKFSGMRFQLNRVRVAANGEPSNLSTTEQDAQSIFSV